MPLPTRSALLVGLFSLLCTALPGRLLAADETPVPVPADAKRTDRHGDALPAGAVARLGSVRLRHAGGVHSVVFAPDGKLLASAGLDSLIRLWEPGSGRQIRQFSPPANSANKSRAG